MKKDKHCTLRRRGSASEMQEAQEKLFRTVDRHYQTERNFLSKQFEKVAVYINDIFCALANHDARFEFDPLSLDDYRCEMVSATEINLICELKGFPECGFEVQGDGSNGTVKIRLTDDYLESCEHPSWNDICSQRSNSSGGNFLNTRALLDVFTAVLGRALSDVWNEHRNVGLVYRVSGNLVSVIVDIPEGGLFTVTLIPALKLPKSRIHGLSVRSDKFLKTLGVSEEFFSAVYAIAKPCNNSLEEVWCLSFNNLQKRVLHLENFACGAHCLYALRFLLNLPSSPRSHFKQLSSHHFQLIALKEYANYPNPEAWAPAKLHKRLMGMKTSLKWFLKDRQCENPFTGVNVFAEFDEKSLKVLAKDISHLKSRERLLETMNDMRSKYV